MLLRLKMPRRTVELRELGPGWDADQVSPLDVGRPRQPDPYRRCHGRPAGHCETEEAEGRNGGDLKRVAFRDPSARLPLDALKILLDG